MENIGFDTILYIIISIVVFIISVFGKNKKGNKPAIRNPEWKTVPDSGKYSQNDNSFISNVENIFSPNEEEIKQKDEIKKDFSSTIKVVERSTKNQEIVTEDTEIKNNLEEKLEDFDIEKAIIYSEILNRKQF